VPPQSDYSVILEWSDRPLAAARWSCHTDNKDSRSASLDRFVVDDRFQAAGFGRRLLAAVEEDMRAVGCRHLHMTAPVDALPALIRLGFRPARLTNRILRTGEITAAVMLTKTARD